MPDKFPPKNSGFRLETYRLPAPSVPVVEAGEADRPSRTPDEVVRVIREAIKPPVGDSAGDSPDGWDEARAATDALLAHGSEHGVAILADGSLRPLTEGEASDA